MDKFSLVLPMAEVGKIVERKGPFLLKTSISVEDTANVIVIELGSMLVTNIQPIIGTFDALVSFEKTK